MSRSRGSRRASLALCLFLALACSPQKSVPPPELAGLHERIRDYRTDFESGIRLIVEGDPVMGQNLLAAATKRLAVAADECARTPGCDDSLFQDTLDVFVAERRLQEQVRQEDKEIDLESESPLLEAIPELGKVVSLFDGTELSDRIPLNEEVQAALNQWLTWNRPELLDAYENYQYLRSKVAPVYEEAGLPEALLFAMMAKETGAKAHAYSRAGAAGPLQFMVKTWRRYGSYGEDGFDMRLDAVAATEANVRYLDDQFRALNNDLETALAAYNAGESRVRRLHRKTGGAGFWDPRIYWSLPSETREYVPQILAAAWLFLHPEDYGLHFPEYENDLTTVMLNEDMSLGELTICLGDDANPRGWFRTLRNLNPRSRTTERLKAGEAIEIPTKLVTRLSERCVSGSPLLDLARGLHDADYPDRAEDVAYTVRPGDSLSKIAERYSCSMRHLAAINGIRGPQYVVHPGQSLTVGGCS